MKRYSGLFFVLALGALIITIGYVHPLMTFPGVDVTHALLSFIQWNRISIQLRMLITLQLADLSYDEAPLVLRHYVSIALPLDFWNLYRVKFYLRIGCPSHWNIMNKISN